MQKNANKIKFGFYHYTFIAIQTAMAYKIYMYDTDTDCIGSGMLSSAYIQMMLDYAGGQDVEVHISSVGGSAFDAIATYDLLKKYNGKVTTYIDALAASAASIVAMAGQTVVMSKYALLMIHKPMLGSGGNADDLAKDVELLNMVQSRLAQIYIDKTGLDEVTINDLINAVTWLSADQALDLNFIDSIEDYAQVENKAKAVTNLTLIKNFSQVAPPIYKRVLNKLTIKEPALEPQTKDTMTTEEKQSFFEEIKGALKKVTNYFKPSLVKVVTNKGEIFALNGLKEGSHVFNDLEMETVPENSVDMEITDEKGKKAKMTVKDGKISNIEQEGDDDDTDSDDDDFDAENKVVLNTAGINFKKSVGAKVVKNALASKLKEVNNKVTQQDAIIIDLRNQLKVVNEAVLKDREEIKNEIKTGFTPNNSQRSNTGKTGDAMPSWATPKADSLEANAVKKSLSNQKK